MWWGSDGDGDRPFLKRFLTEVAEGVVPTSWWEYEFAGSNRNATVEFRNLFERDLPFDTPKPTKLIRRILQLTTAPESGELVLDFFAGSATTAHAILEMNREDGGNRRFILVQLPELTGNDRYPTIAEIGKDRIRRALTKLGQETGNLLRQTPEDLGFKVFKLAAPNIEQWVPDNDRDPERYASKLHLFDDPLVADWKPENVLWEVALREGFGLNTRYVKKTLANGNDIYEVTDPDKDPQQTFLLCLDDEVRADLSKHQPLTADTLFICRDKALDDTAAANLALQCRLKTI